MQSNMLRGPLQIDGINHQKWLRHAYDAFSIFMNDGAAERCVSERIRFQAMHARMKCM